MPLKGGVEINFLLFTYFIYAYVCLARFILCAPHARQKLSEARHHKPLRANMRVLETKLRSSLRTVSSLNH